MSASTESAPLSRLDGRRVSFSLRTPGAGLTRWRALFTLATGYFLIMLDQGLMPVITPRLPTDAANAVWLTSIYLLWTVVPMPVTGRLGDRFGQRQVYLAGMCVCAVGLALAAASWDWPVLVAARAVQGLGSAVFLPQAFGLINRVFPADGRGRAFAAWGVVGSVGSLLGPVLGGVIVDGFGWRAAFACQGGLAVAGALCASVWLPALPTTPVKIRVAPVMLTFLGLTLLVSGIQSLNSWNIILGVVLLAGLVSHERDRGNDAVIPVGLFRDRDFAYGTAAITMMGFAVAAMFIPIMYWLQSGLGVSAQIAGALTAPMSVVAMVATPYAGALADRAVAKWLCVAGFTIMAASLGAAYLLTLTGGHYAWFALVTALLGLGSAFVWAPNAAATMRGVADQDAGAASGVYNTLRQVGSVVGVAATGAVLAAGDPATTSGPAVLLSAVAVLVGAVASAFLTGSTTAARAVSYRGSR